MVKEQRCPICEKHVTQASTTTTLFPFCSDRCKKVDLFRWWEGRYEIVEEVDPMVAEFLRDDPDITVQGEGVERSGSDHVG